MPLPEHVAEVLLRIPDPASERLSWRKDHEEHLRRVQVEHK